MKKTLTTLALTVSLLIGAGFILLTSASAIRAVNLYNVPHFFVKRQVIWLAVGVFLAYCASRFDYHFWKRYPLLPIIFYGVVALGLILVFVPGIGERINGSYRWLKLGPIRVQPSEFAKFAVVVVLSAWMESIGWRVKQFKKGALYPCLILGCLAGLIMVEWDFGGMAVVTMLGVGIMFATGTKLRHLIFLGALGGVVVGMLLMANPNRRLRIEAFFHDLLRSKAEQAELAAKTDAQTAAKVAKIESSKYQINQAILAFKNGGLLGVGFNRSIQKHRYLPEPHTDCIMAIGGEEFGFVFTVGVLLGFAVVLVCGVLISMHAPDRLGSLLAFGMTLLLVSQAVINMGVVTGCLPPKGLAMPFISYGGTNLVVSLIAVGTLFNIGRHVDVFDEGLHTQVARNAINQI